MKERIVSTDIWNILLQIALEKKFKVFFWGGGLSEDKAVMKIKNIIPKLNICGVLSGEKSLTITNIEIINKSKPDILFFGLGTPQQEILLNKYRDLLKIPLCITVGSYIDFLSGYKKRAPAGFQRLGLEWLFRVFQEPRRLWRRYLLGIPFFIYKISKDKFKLIFNKDIA